MNYLLHCGWCLLLSTSTLLAAPPDTLTLSLEDCIGYALKHNLQIKQDALAIETGQADLTQAKMALLPSVGAVSRYNHNVGRSVNPVTNEFVDQPIRSQDYGIDANVTLYDGWRNVRTIHNQRDALAAARYDLSASQRETVLTVMQAFLSVLSRRELWKEARRRALETDQGIRHTRVLVNSGEVSPTSLTQMQAQRADDQLTLIRRQNDWQLAQLALRQLLFLPTDQPLRVAHPTVEQHKPLTKQPLAVLYERVQASEPALLGAATRQTIAERNVKIAQGAFLPTLSLTIGGFSSYSDRPPIILEDPSYSNQLKFNLRKYIGFELSVPIYRQGRTQAQVQRSRINQRQADLALLQAQQQLQETLESVYWGVQTSAKEYQASLIRQATAQEAYRSANVQFELGIIDVIAYRQAKSQLNEARATRIQAKYQALLNRKILSFLMNPLTVK